MDGDWQKEAKYLQEQLDNQRYDREREQERAYQEREAARRQRQRENLEAQCCADDWNEAFNKAIPRLQHEASMEDPEKYPDETYFAGQVAEHKAAYEIWQEEMRLAQKLIARIKQRARERAAKRVNEKFGKETMVAENLRNDDYNALVNW